MFRNFWNRDAPLYLEWAPGNILSQNSTILDDTNNAVSVGEHQAKRALLEQHVEGIVGADVDPDRIEVLTIPVLFNCEVTKTIKFLVSIVSTFYFGWILLTSFTTLYKR